MLPPQSPPYWQRAFSRAPPRRRQWLSLLSSGGKRRRYQSARIESRRRQGKLQALCRYRYFSLLFDCLCCSSACTDFSLSRLPRHGHSRFDPDRARALLGNLFKQGFEWPSDGSCRQGFQMFFTNFEQLTPSLSIRLLVGQQVEFVKICPERITVHPAHVRHVARVIQDIALSTACF